MEITVLKNTYRNPFIYSFKHRRAWLSCLLTGETEPHSGQVLKEFAGERPLYLSAPVHWVESSDPTHLSLGWWKVLDFSALLGALP
jgi:hypothetical protein